jgi:hypothetical protein
VVVELVVVVAVVVEVEVAVADSVPFGHHRPPKMSKIISITLFDKEVVLKKIITIKHFMLLHSHNNHHPALPFVMLPLLPTLYPFHLMLIVALLIFCS